MLSYGQIAYEAYADETGWRNYQGNMMPEWKDLPPKIRAAWEAAAHAVTSERNPN